MRRGRGPAVPGKRAPIKGTLTRGERGLGTACIANEPSGTLTRGERGAIAVWASMAIPAFVLAVGLGVDLAGHTAAQQEARSLAGEAARAAGQYLVIKPGVRARAQPARGERAAASYLAASGLTGRTHVAGDGTIVVEVEGAYETRFLSLMGVTSLPVAGTARAQVVTVVDGEQR